MIFRKKPFVFLIVLLSLSMAACNLSSGGQSPAATATNAGAAPVQTQAPGPTAEAPTGEQPAAPTAAPTSPPVVAGNYNWSALDARLAGYVPNTVKGLTLILARDGQVLFLKGYGDQGADTVQTISSSTEIASAMAILTLVDEGKLNLDAPVVSLLSEGYAWPADKATITMRMLLNHTSGLVSDPPCVRQKSDMILVRCVDEILSAPLVSAPGSQFAYSSADYQVAGFVATEIAQRPTWIDFFAERISNPLGLQIFTFGKENNAFGSDKNPRISSGVATNVTDFNTILQMFLAGGKFGDRQILSQAVIAEMQNNQVAGIPRVDTPGRDSFTGFSFGWWITDSSQHPGSNGPELSAPGNFGSIPWVDLDLRYSGVLLLKERLKSGVDIWNAIRPIIIEELKKTQ